MIVDPPVPGAAAPARPAGGRPLEPVLDRMQALAAELPKQDGIAVFNRMYLTVTEAISGLLAPPTGETGRPSGATARFLDPPTAAGLAVDFAGRYLAAVDADAGGLRLPGCWRPLFRLRGHPRIRPLQFALAGMNAHICHDLPMAVVSVCRARGLEPEELAHDYNRVDAVLGALDERVREELMPGPDVLELADPLTHLVDSWSLARARDAAWATARVLWKLREHPELTEDFADGLDRSVGLVGRQLLTPVP